MNTTANTTVEKFTPGPWANDSRGEKLVGSNGKQVGVYGLYVYGSLQRTEETEANAKLIAAAPEMYEAIKNYIAAVEDGEVVEQFDALKAAIKKATE